MLKNTKNSVNSRLSTAVPPNARLVPAIVNMLAIPIGMQLLKSATKAAIPNGASSLFMLKLTQESKNDTAYTINIFLDIHFFITSFILYFLFN